MNENIENTDQNVSTVETKNEESNVEKTTEENPQEPSIDPLKEELEKVEKKNKGKTELEKAIFTKKQIEKRIAELKGQTGEEHIPDIEADDDAPLTVGMLKKLEKEKSIQTASNLAEQKIEDENELKLVKYHLSNTIKPSGSAEEDLRHAVSIVNAVKNKQIVEELGRKSTPRRTSSGSSAPERQEDKFEPTPDEVAFMKMKGYDGKPLLSKDDIIKARTQTKKD